MGKKSGPIQLQALQSQEPNGHLGPRFMTTRILTRNTVHMIGQVALLAV